MTEIFNQRIIQATQDAIQRQQQYRIDLPSEGSPVRPVKLLPQTPPAPDELASAEQGGNPRKLLQRLAGRNDAQDGGTLAKPTSAERRAARHARAAEKARERAASAQQAEAARRAKQPPGGPGGSDNLGGPVDPNTLLYANRDTSQPPVLPTNFEAVLHLVSNPKGRFRRVNYQPLTEAINAGREQKITPEQVASLVRLGKNDDIQTSLRGSLSNFSKARKIEEAIVGSNKRILNTIDLEDPTNAAVAVRLAGNIADANEIGQVARNIQRIAVVRKRRRAGKDFVTIHQELNRRFDTGTHTYPVVKEQAQAMMADGDVIQRLKSAFATETLENRISLGYAYIRSGSLVEGIAQALQFADLADENREIPQGVKVRDAVDNVVKAFGALRDNFFSSSNPDEADELFIKATRAAYSNKDFEQWVANELSTISPSAQLPSQPLPVQGPSHTPRPPWGAPTVVAEAAGDLPLDMPEPDSRTDQEVIVAQNVLQESLTKKIAEEHSGETEVTLNLRNEDLTGLLHAGQNTTFGSWDTKNYVIKSYSGKDALRLEEKNAGNDDELQQCAFIITSSSKVYLFGNGGSSSGVPKTQTISGHAASAMALALNKRVAGSIPSEWDFVSYNIPAGGELQIILKKNSNSPPPAPPSPAGGAEIKYSEAPSEKQIQQARNVIDSYQALQNAKDAYGRAKNGATKQEAYREAHNALLKIIREDTILSEAESDPLAKKYVEVLETVSSEYADASAGYDKAQKDNQLTIDAKDKLWEEFMEVHNRVLDNLDMLPPEDRPSGVIAIENELIDVVVKRAHEILGGDALSLEPDTPGAGGGQDISQEQTRPNRAVHPEQPPARDYQSQLSIITQEIQRNHPDVTAEAVATVASFMNTHADRVMELNSQSGGRQTLMGEVQAEAQKQHNTALKNLRDADLNEILTALGRGLRASVESDSDDIKQEQERMRNFLSLQGQEDVQKAEAIEQERKARAQKIKTAAIEWGKKRGTPEADEALEKLIQDNYQPFVDDIRSLVSTSPEEIFRILDEDYSLQFQDSDDTNVSTVEIKTYFCQIVAIQVVLKDMVSAQDRDNLADKITDEVWDKIQAMEGSDVDSQAVVGSFGTSTDSDQRNAGDPEVVEYGGPVTTVLSKIPDQSTARYNTQSGILIRESIPNPEDADNESEKEHRRQAIHNLISEQARALGDPHKGKAAEQNLFILYGVFTQDVNETKRIGVMGYNLLLDTYGKSEHLTPEGFASLPISASGEFMSLVKAARDAAGKTTGSSPEEVAFREGLLKELQEIDQAQGGDHQVFLASSGAATAIQPADAPRGDASQMSTTTTPTVHIPTLPADTYRPTVFGPSVEMNYVAPDQMITFHEPTTLQQATATRGPISSENPTTTSTQLAAEQLRNLGLSQGAIDNLLSQQYGQFSFRNALEIERFIRRSFNVNDRAELKGRLMDKTPEAQVAIIADEIHQKLGGISPFVAQTLTADGLNFSEIARIHETGLLNDYIAGVVLHPYYQDTKQHAAQLSSVHDTGLYVVHNQHSSNQEGLEEEARKFWEYANTYLGTLLQVQNPSIHKEIVNEGGGFLIGKGQQRAYQEMQLTFPEEGVLHRAFALRAQTIMGKVFTFTHQENNSAVKKVYAEAEEKASVPMSSEEQSLLRGMLDRLGGKLKQSEPEAVTVVDERYEERVAVYDEMLQFVPLQVFAPSPELFRKYVENYYQINLDEGVIENLETYRQAILKQEKEKHLEEVYKVEKNLHEYARKIQIDAMKIQPTPVSPIMTP